MLARQTFPPNKEVLKESTLRARASWLRRRAPNINGRPRSHVHRWVSMPSSTCSGSKRSNKTNGTSDQRQAREVKHPLACAIASAIASVWVVFKFQCTNDWVLLRNVANVWITNLGWPVVPEVVRRTAGAFVSIGLLTCAPLI